MAETRKVGAFFTRVGERGEPPKFVGNKPVPPRQGQLGMIMNMPMLRFQELHPEQRCRWEHVPEKDSMSLVPFREAQGYHVVQAEELNPEQASAQKTGPIRKGDLILMAAPKEVHEAILGQDSEAAENDAYMPERTYKEALAAKQYKAGDSQVLPGRPFGEIRRSTEQGTPEDFVEVTPNRTEGGETK